MGERKYLNRVVAWMLVVLMAVTMVPSGRVWAKSKVKLNKTKLTVQVGVNKTLKLKTVSKKQAKKIKWKSSKKKVALVSKKGVVTAKNKGKTTITAKYKGKKYTCKVTVKARSITGCIVGTIPAQKYTGKAIRPTVVVRDGSSVLKVGKDYSVSYSGNVNAGIARVAIQGINNYTGKKDVTFRIVKSASANTSGNGSNNNGGTKQPTDPAVEGVQFVLHWDKQDSEGKVCANLDAHLVGPTADGKSMFHVYHAIPTYSDEEGTLRVELDQDDMDYEGPETVEIKVLAAGTYRFYVSDCCHEETGEKAGMMDSHPWVEVKQGTSVKRFDIPAGSDGTLWEVCSFNSVTGQLAAGGKAEYPLVGEEDFGLKSNVEVIYDLRKAAKEIGLDTSEDYRSLNEKISGAKGIEIRGLVQQLREMIEDEKMKVRALSAECSQDRSIGVDDPGNFDEEGNGRLWIRTFDGEVPTDLSVEVSEGCSWALKDSDKADYKKMVVVSSTRSSITTKYYIEIEQVNIISCLERVLDEGNIIGSAVFAPAAGHIECVTMLQRRDM